VWDGARNQVAEYLTTKGWRVARHRVAELYAANGFQLPDHEALAAFREPVYVSAELTSMN